MHCLKMFQLRSLPLESCARVNTLFQLFGAVGLMTSLLTFPCTPLRPIGRDMAGPTGSADRGHQLSRSRTGRKIFTHDDDASILVRSGGSGRRRLASSLDTWTVGWRCSEPLRDGGLRWISPRHKYCATARGHHLLQSSAPPFPLLSTIFFHHPSSKIFVIPLCCCPPEPWASRRPPPPPKPG